MASFLRKLDLTFSFSLRTRWLVLPVILVCCLTLGLGVPLGGRAIIILALFAGAGLALSCFNRVNYFRLLFFLLPCVGLLSIEFNLKAVSVLMPYCAFGMMGGLLQSVSRKKRNVTFYFPAAVWLYIVSVSFSLLIGFHYVTGFLMDREMIVSHAPWGEVKLVNAYGWIVLSGITAFSGFFMFHSLQGQSEINRNHFLRSLFWGCYLSGFLGLLQFLGWTTRGMNDVFLGALRYTGGSVHPTVLGIFSSVLLFIWLGYVLSYPREKKFIFLGPSLIFLIVISGSRAPFVLVGAGLVAFFIIDSPLKKTQRFFYLVAIIGCIVAMTTIAQLQLPHSRSFQLFKDLGSFSLELARDVTAIAPIYPPRKRAHRGILSSKTGHPRGQKIVFRRGGSARRRPGSRVGASGGNGLGDLGEDVNPSGSAFSSLKFHFFEKVHVFLYNRTPFWMNGWETFKHHPILGCGVGTYLFRFPTYVGNLKSTMNDNACNMFLQVADEQGLLGLLVFIFVLMGPIGKHFERSPVNREPFKLVAVAGLIGLASSFLFGSHLINFEINLVFWFMLSQFYPARNKSKNVLQMSLIGVKFTNLFPFSWLKRILP